MPTFSIPILTITPNPISENGGLLRMTFSNDLLISNGLDVTDPELFIIYDMGIIFMPDGDSRAVSVEIFEPPYTEVTVEVPNISVPGTEQEILCTITLIVRVRKKTSIGFTFDGDNMLRVKKGVTPHGEFAISNIAPKRLDIANVTRVGASLRVVGSSLDKAVSAFFTNNASRFPVVMRARSQTSMVISVPAISVDVLKMPPFTWKVGLIDNYGNTVYSPLVSLS